MTPPVHVTVTTDREGAPIVSKLGRTPEAKARLRREAWILEGLRHPGVVELLELREMDDDLRLNLALAGSRTVQDWGAQQPTKIASLLAAVATTMADVHTQGMGHRRLTADHIVLDRNGQPVVVGWAEAGPPHLGDDDLWVDPPAEDVAAIGLLVTDLLEAPDERKSRSERGVRRKLVTLARDCAAERAPTMHDLGTQLARLAGDGGLTNAEATKALEPDRLADMAGLSDDSTPSDGSVLRSTVAPTNSTGAHAAPAELAAGVGVGAADQPPDSEKTLEKSTGMLESLGLPKALAGAAVMAIALFALLGWIVRGTTPDPANTFASDPTTTTRPENPIGADDRPSGSPQTTEPQVAATVDLKERDQSEGRADRCDPDVFAPDDTIGLDTDGDGCLEQVVIEGNRVQIDATTYEVGRPGDTVLVGDWDCDGRATPIVVRPDDKAIHVFARWARADQGLTATFGGRLPPDTEARTVDDGEGCHVLELTGPTGVERHRLRDMGGMG